MGKYIDAEKLRQEIEFLRNIYNDPNRVIHGVADAFRQDGRVAMCDDILKKVESLQQEQSDADLEVEIKRWWDKWYANVDRKYKFNSTRGHYLDNETIIAFASHFAEWGATHRNVRKDKLPEK